MKNTVVFRCLCYFASLLSGQVSTGTIVGVVEDSTGAIVPNAAVRVVHTATQDLRQALANERGEFNIPFVRIGEHSVTAEMQGFSRKDAHRDCRARRSDSESADSA